MNSRLALAAHVLSLLASARERVHCSSELARSVNTNPVVIRRLLAALAKAGIVVSEKGKAGGFKLARCPSEISLWDLSNALGQAHLFKVHENPANPDCKVSCGMKDALGQVFADAEKAAQAKLRRVSVRDLLESAG